MRKLTDEEMRKRGCRFCLDMRKEKLLIKGDCGKEHPKLFKVCIHEACPFRVLDQYNTYEQYFKALGTPHKFEGIR